MQLSLGQYKNNTFSIQPGQKVEISIVISQEGNDFVYRHNVHVEFDDPLREVIEYETDPESASNTTLRPRPLSTGKNLFRKKVALIVIFYITADYITFIV